MKNNISLHNNSGLVLVTSNKRALCIGINNFQFFPHYQLLGCLNDTKNISTVLKKYLHFKESDITFLLDSEATKKNIYKHLDSIIKQANDGECDHIVIHYASHGTQIPDVTGDEIDDLKDEVFTTCKLNVDRGGKNWLPDTFIDDDDFGKKLSNIKESVLCEVFFDTCHSGTGLRALIMNEVPRYIPPPSDAMNRGLARLQPHTLADTLRETDVGSPPNIILMVGCQADQTSADAKIENDYHGVFTWNLCNEIRKCDNKISRYELLKNIRSSVKNGHEQVPQLECKSTLYDLPVGQLK